jgi:5-methylcytosine-specific restriction protein A
MRCAMAKLAMLKPRVATIDTSIAAPPPKLVEPFYTSRAWLELMAGIKRERGERCQDCGRGRCRIFGDHIVELKDGGAKLDPRNVRLRCGSCHTLKTNAQRAKRMRA